jgi:hypothetical protein
MLHHLDKLAVTKVTWFADRYRYAASDDAYPKSVESWEGFRKY